MKTIKSNSFGLKVYQWGSESNPVPKNLCQYIFGIIYSFLAFVVMAGLVGLFAFLAGVMLNSAGAKLGVSIENPILSTIVNIILGIACSSLVLVAAAALSIAISYVGKALLEKISMLQEKYCSPIQIEE